MVYRCSTTGFQGLPLPQALLHANKLASTRGTALAVSAAGYTSPIDGDGKLQVYPSNGQGLYLLPTVRAYLLISFARLVGVAFTHMLVTLELHGRAYHQPLFQGEATGFSDLKRAYAGPIEKNTVRK